MSGSSSKSPKSASASPGVIKNGAPEMSKTGNQAMFKLNKMPMLLWRRALLVRYYKILGDETNTKVKWCDYDSKSKIITINDERKNFEWKKPHADLFKSSVHVTTYNKKKFVVTLFYTTLSVLVQGQLTEQWVISEYPKINSSVIDLERSKGDKSINIDKIFSNIPYDDETFNVSPILNTMDSSEEEQSKEKHGKENLDSENIEVEQEKTINYTQIDQKKNDENYQSEIKENDIQKSIEKFQIALHTIEANQIEKETKMNRILKVSAEIQDKLAEISTLKADVAIVKNSIQKLESVIDSRFDKIHACLQKQSEFMHERTKPNTTIDFENKVVELKSEFSKASKKISEEVEDIQKTYHTHAEKLDNEILVLKNITQELQHKTTDGKTSTDERSIKKSVISEENFPQSNRYETLEKTEPNKTESDKSINNTKDPNTTDVWIIGTSITKNLIPKKMYLNKKVRITTLQDKTISGAKNYIKSGKVQTDHILLQVGSNDLESNTPDEVMQYMEHLISEIKNRLPTSKILIAELLPRFYRNSNQMSDFEEKRLLYNSLLKDFCFDVNIEYVNFEEMSHDDFYDGIHMNQNGIKHYVKCVKRVLNPLLGVQTKLSVESQSNKQGQNDRDFHDRRGVHSNHRYGDNYNSIYSKYRQTLGVNDKQIPVSRFRESFSPNNFYDNMSKENQHRYSLNRYENQNRHTNREQGYDTYSDQYMYMNTRTDSPKQIDKERIFNMFERMLRVI